MSEPAAPVHIVDDEEAIRDALAWLLSSRGIASQCYDSGEAFLGTYSPEMRGIIILGGSFGWRRLGRWSFRGGRCCCADRGHCAGACCFLAFGLDRKPSEWVVGCGFGLRSDCGCRVFGFRDVYQSFFVHPSRKNTGAGHRWVQR